MRDPLRDLVDEGFVVEVWRDSAARFRDERYVALLTLGTGPQPAWRGSGTTPQAAMKQARGFWAEDSPGASRPDTPCPPSVSPGGPPGA